VGTKEYRCKANYGLIKLRSLYIFCEFFFMLKDHRNFKDRMVMVYTLSLQF